MLHFHKLNVMPNALIRAELRTSPRYNLPIKRIKLPGIRKFQVADDSAHAGDALFGSNQCVRAAHVGSDPSGME